MSCCYFDILLLWMVIIYHWTCVWHAWDHSRVIFVRLVLKLVDVFLMIDFINFVVWCSFWCHIERVFLGLGCCWSLGSCEITFINFIVFVIAIMMSNLIVIIAFVNNYCCYCFDDFLYLLYLSDSRNWIICCCCYSFY